MRLAAVPGPGRGQAAVIVVGKRSATRDLVIRIMAVATTAHEARRA